MYLFFSFFFFVVKKKNVSSTLSANFKYAIQFCKLYSQCWSLELIYLHNLKFCMTWQVFPLPHYLETTVLLFSSIYLTILDSTYKETMHYLSFCEVKWSEIDQSCLTLCHSMYYDLPGSSVCGILLGAGVRHSAHGKGHEEGGLTYAKAGSSLRSPPGYPRASTPITRACLLYYFVLSPTPLALRGAVPHHLFRRRS